MEALFDQLADVLDKIRERTVNANQFNTAEYAYILAASETDAAAATARAIVDQMIQEARRGR